MEFTIAYLMLGFWIWFTAASVRSHKFTKENIKRNWGPWLLGIFICMLIWPVFPFYIWFYVKREREGL